MGVCSESGCREGVWVCRALRGEHAGMRHVGLAGVRGLAGEGLAGGEGWWVRGWRGVRVGG